MRATAVAGTMFALGLVALGCDGESATAIKCPGGGACQQTTLLFDAPSRAPLDLVLVVDLAALAGERAEQLRTALRAIAPYTHASFDSHVVLLSARPEEGSPPAPPPLWPLPSGPCALQVGVGFLRDTNTCGGPVPNFEGPLDQQLACAIPDVRGVPTGPGQPIQALLDFLARAPAMAGVIRPEAHLAIGLFTAGDDAQAVGPMADVLHAGLVRLKGDDPRRVSLQAFVDLPDGQPCAPAPGMPGGAPLLTAFAQRFPQGGLSTSCSREWSNQFQTVVPSMLTSYAVPCLPAPLIDRDPAAAGVQPECVVEEGQSDGTGAPAYRVVPACTGAPGQRDCWRPSPDMTCLSRQRMIIERTCTPPAGTFQRLTCATGG